MLGLGRGTLEGHWDTTLFGGTVVASMLLVAYVCYRSLYRSGLDEMRWTLSGIWFENQGSSSVSWNWD